MDTDTLIPKIPIAIDTLPLFDEQFSIRDFTENLEAEEEAADSIMCAVRNAVKKAAGRMDEEDKTRYVVDIDEKTCEAIDAGEVKLDTNSAGEIFAQLRDKNGHYSNKLCIFR